jgi:sialic acid synthase SpsE
MPLEHLPAITIGGRRIAEDIPPFVIAEIGINHGGSLERAIALVDAAAESGAHAVKFQTIVSHQLVAESCPAPAHVEAASLVEFFRQFELDEPAHEVLAARARQRGLKVMATPFSLPAVDLLDRVGIDAFKIASGDITFDALIARAASTGRPVVISTGMSTIAEAQHALAVFRAAGGQQAALLHCVSAYPVPRGSENLRAIRSLADECRVPVGLSDHGDDTFALPVAVGLGASLYERHLMLAGDETAIDGPVSSTPPDLAAAIRAGRRTWAALGTGRKACLPAEAVNLNASRRSLCAARHLPAGHVLSANDLIALRPATGLPPSSLDAVLSHVLTKPMAQGDPLTEDHLEKTGRYSTGHRPEAHRVA